MLFVNQLVGFGAYPMSSGTTTITFLSSGINTSDQTNYTFSSIGLGSSNSSRYIIVAAHGIHNVARTLNSVSVAGISATQIQNLSFASGTRAVGIFVAPVPSGTSGDIVLNFSGAMGRAGYGAWYLISSTDATSAYASGGTATLSGSDLVLSLGTPSGGAAVAAVVESSTSGTVTCTWTNITEDYDSAYTTEANTQGQSGANISTDGSTISVTNTITNVSAGNVGLVAASFS